MNNRAEILHTTIMKKLYFKLICTAALIAALGVCGCSDMNGDKQTSPKDIDVTQQRVNESNPDDGCPDDNEHDKNGDCPDGDCDGDDKKDECPDGNCPNKDGKGKNGKRTKPGAPKGRFGSIRKRPTHPKLPVKPPEDDVILPDPPIEEPQN